MGKKQPDRFVGLVRALVLAGLVAGLPGAGDAAPTAGFESLCERALTPDAGAWFAGELDAVDGLLAAGRLDVAFDRHALAVAKLPRTADVSVAGKCVGRPLYTRWYEQGRTLRRARAEASPDRWLLVLEGGLARAGASDAPSAEQLAARVPDEPRATADAIGRLRGPGETIEWERSQGMYVIDLEEAAARAAAAALDVLNARAAERTRAALAAEATAFTSEGAVPDARLAAGVRSAESMTTAMAGLAPEAGRAETQGLLVRGQNARHLLRDAAAWAEVAGDEAMRSVRRRAEQRGDVFREAGDAAAYAFAVRDDHYAVAIGLYEDAGAAEKLAATRRAREATRAGLDRERLEREAALEAAAERLEKDAEGMREAARQMEKTESEKEAFDAEFDEEFGDMDGFFE